MYQVLALQISLPARSVTFCLLLGGRDAWFGRSQVPGMQLEVRAGRNQFAAIGCKGELEDAVWMTAKSGDDLARNGLPQLDLPGPKRPGVIRRTRRQHQAVLAESQRSDVAGVTGKRADFRSGGRVPQSNQLVRAPTRQKSTQRRESHRVDFTLMPRQGLDAKGLIQIPDADCLIRAARGQQIIDRAVGEAAD